MDIYTHNNAPFSLDDRQELIDSLNKLISKDSTPFSSKFSDSLAIFSEPLSFFTCINEYLFILNNKILSQSFYNTLKIYIPLDVLDVYFDYQLINSDEDDFFTILDNSDEDIFKTNSRASSFIIKKTDFKNAQLGLFGDEIDFLTSQYPAIIEQSDESTSINEQTITPDVDCKAKCINKINNGTSLNINPSDSNRYNADLSETINNTIDISNVTSAETDDHDDHDDHDEFNSFEMDEDDCSTNDSDSESDDIYSALDSYIYDFEDDELDNAVDLGIEDSTVSRELRAQQKAIEFIILSEWSSKKYLGLVSDIFYKYGWSATKTALERLLEFNLTPTELELLFEIKIFWEEHDYYWIAFERGGSSYSYSQYVMSWNSALKIARAFDSYPCIEEIANVIDRLYEVWISKKTLQRRYWRFIGFVWLWAFETKGFLPTCDSYVFENNACTPEAWEDHTDLFDVQLIRDKEHFGLPAQQVNDPHWYWTESRIQQFNQDFLSSDTK